MPLHVIKEMLDALESVESGDIAVEEPDSEEVVMSVAQKAFDNNPKRRTLRLCGQIGKLPNLIFVDSRSIGIFISTGLAEQLPHALSDCRLAQFITADGSPMTCSKEVQGLH